MQNDLWRYAYPLESDIFAKCVSRATCMRQVAMLLQSIYPIYIHYFIFSQKV